MAGFDTSEMDQNKPVNIETKIQTLVEKDPVGVAKAEEDLTKLNEQGGELGTKLKAVAKILGKIGLSLVCLLCMVSLTLLYGCSKPPAEVTKVRKYRDEAIANYGANMELIAKDYGAMYEGEANNHTDYRFAITLREQLAANKDAAGKVDATAIEAFVKELVAKRDARRAEASKNVADKQAVSAKARADLVLAQRFDALIQKYYDSGFDPTVLADSLAEFLPLKK